MVIWEQQNSSIETSQIYILWDQTSKLYSYVGYLRLGVSVFIMFLSVCLLPCLQVLVRCPPQACISFLWQATVIRAAELNRLFQIHTSTHTFELEHLNRQPLHSSASLPIFSPSLMFCRFQLKRCWPLKNCQQNQSTLAFMRSNHKACVRAWMWIVCLCQFMMYLLIMGNTFLRSDRH